MDPSDEMLCLKWNGFQENAISSNGILRMENEFADVTLACEDRQQVEVHKVIMASSSPFFLNLLRRNKQPHPLIYMRGLKSEDLVAMVDFLYFGEANVYQENLDSFLAVAEELQLKGLMGSGAEEEVEDKIEPTAAKTKTPKQVQSKTYFPHEAPAYDMFNPVDKTEPEPSVEGTVAVTDYTVATNLQDLDDKIKSMIEVSENIINSKQGRARICKVCGKNGTLGQIRNHIEANHITGVSHTCNICGKTARSRHALEMHKSTYHKS